jgi:Tfp pilus assembly protein PilN
MGLNLLPPNQRSSITYARRNTILRNWIVFLLTGLVGLTVLIAIGLWYINYSVATQTSQNNTLKEQVASQKQDQIEKQASVISNNFKLTLKVLQQQIYFSKLLNKVGEVMPKNSSLEGLTISSEQNTIDLSVVARDYQSATQVQINITDPSKKLFDKADILDVSCSNTGDYPCKITLKAVFAKDSGLKFKASGAKK